MRVAIFLDVDKTLTRRNIQHDFAAAMNCEKEYLGIEGRFQSRAITSKQFGEEIIELFASKGFTRDKAESLYQYVTLESWADKILSMKIDKFLVSSGPSYYIDRLAEKYRIEKDRVLCSDYQFSERTNLIASCDAVGNQQKDAFVKKQLENYDVTIGIGDSPQYDTFLSHCTIPLLTTQTEEYLYLPNFGLAISLTERITSLSGATGSFDIGSRELISLAKRLTVDSVIMLLGILAAVFWFGVGFSKYL